MVIWVKDADRLITAVEGTGDNLTADDEAEGLVDYMMTSIYRIDGEEVVLEDGGQMMTSVYIKDLEYEEIAERLLDYWGLSEFNNWSMLDY